MYFRNNSYCFPTALVRTTSNAIQMMTLIPVQLFTRAFLKCRLFKCCVSHEAMNRFWTGNKGKFKLIVLIRIVMTLKTFHEPTTKDNTTLSITNSNTIKLGVYNYVTNFFNHFKINTVNND